MEKMKNLNPLNGKYCKVRWKNGFTLEGLILKANEDGIIFQTDQSTEWLSFSVLKNIKPLGEGGK